MSEIPQAAIEKAVEKMMRLNTMAGDPEHGPIDPWEYATEVVQAALEEMGIRVEESTIVSTSGAAPITQRRYFSPWLPVEPSDG